jgi:class 3 adenylate cyclase/CHASE2 domain-containing sensor protein
LYCSGFFVYSGRVKSRASKLLPPLICAGILALFCFLEIVSSFSTLPFVQRLEWISYDWRARLAAGSSTVCATNLAAIFLDDQTVEWLEGGGLGDPVSWPYPKYLHGRLVRELHAEGVKVVGFDVLLSGSRPEDEDEVWIPDNPEQALQEKSGEFFARQLREASNVVLAATSRSFPAQRYRTNAWALGHIIAEKDSDAVLRRTKPFVEVRNYGRLWNLGIILAARELNLDLQNPRITSHQIVLTGANGIQRSIPLDENGNFLIDWRLSWNDPRILHFGFGQVLTLDNTRRAEPHEKYLAYIRDLRSHGKTNFVGENPFQDKLVVIGSIMEGNNLTDLGATPLAKETPLVSKHWNVANSIITDRFIRPFPLAGRLSLLLLLVGIAGVLTWRFRTLVAFFSLIVVAAAYIAFGVVLYVQYLRWLPLALPVLAAVTTYGGLITYRVGFEQREQRRVKSIFSKIVSPNIVHELLTTESLALGGARRRITVFFSDVRGFTEMTDTGQAKAEEHIRQRNLTGATAEAFRDQKAREDLATVNLYLGLIADIVKKHEGTLDKYIGDCVMSFWGAPTPNERHALCCVRAAIEAQRAIYAINTERASENKRRQEENARRTESGQELLPLQPVLMMGAGINTGMATVGLMGSEAHIVNYTVFGREVNLASRLEGVSGRGRVIISEATYRDIARDDPGLAAACVEMPSVTVKGIRDSLKIYEVPWKQSAAAAKPQALNPTE